LAVHRFVRETLVCFECSWRRIPSSRKILAPAVHGNITHLSGKRESWHHPSVLFSDNAWIECYRSSPSRARRHQARIRAAAHMVIASCRAFKMGSCALPRIWWDKLPGCQLPDRHLHLRRRRDGLSNTHLHSDGKDFCHPHI
jgi:hypothetical protein